MKSTEGGTQEELWPHPSFGTSLIPGWASLPLSVHVVMATAHLWLKAPVCRPTSEHSEGATYRDGVFLALFFAW